MGGYQRNGHAVFHRKKHSLRRTNWCLRSCNEQRVIRTFVVVLMFHLLGTILFLITNEHNVVDSEASSFRRSSNAGLGDNVKHITTRSHSHWLENQTATAAEIQDTKIWLAGMILDFSDMKPMVKKALLSLNCKHSVGIHMLLLDDTAASQARHDYEHMVTTMHHQNKESYKSHSCAPIITQHQLVDLDFAADLSMIQNRIDRISKLRDLQRSMLEELIYDIGGNNRDDNAIVVIADLDLFKLPDVDKIMTQIDQLRRSDYPHDAICAAGITIHSGDRKAATGTDKPGLWYYDTFATVFYPDTFSHPIKRRLIRHIFPAENPRFVRSDDPNGNFTQGDINRYFLENGKGADVPTTRVASCFGGMAIYRANAYFNRKCQYQLEVNADRLKGFLERRNPDDGSLIDPQSDLYIMRYANKKEKRPCEHVVLHDCLKSSSKGAFDIAVNPFLKSFWARDF